MRRDVSCYTYGGRSDSDPLEAISSIRKGARKWEVRTLLFCSEKRD